jgi:hypothetical protein
MSPDLLSYTADMDSTLSDLRARRADWASLIHDRRLDDLVRQVSDIRSTVDLPAATEFLAGRGDWASLIHDRQLDDLVRQVSDIRSTVDLDAAFRAAQWFQDLQTAFAASLPAVQHLFAREAELGAGFGAELRRHLADLVEHEAHDETAVAALQGFVAVFLSKSLLLARDPTHFYGMVQILLAFLFLWLTKIDGAEMEARLTDRLENAGQRIERKLEESTRHLEARLEESTRRMLDAVERLRPEDESCSGRRVVTRQTTLKKRPGSTTIRTVYPNEVVEELQIRGRWMKVKVFDFTKGEASNGWILSEFTQVISRTNPLRTTTPTACRSPKPHPPDKWLICPSGSGPLSQLDDHSPAPPASSLALANLALDDH